MTDVRFYHLTRSRLEDALPVMLQRTLEREARAVVRFASPERLSDIDEALWTFDDAQFIPHGHEKTGFAEQQPVWLTLGLDNPGEGAYLFVADGGPIDGFEGFEVCSILFDGRDEQAVAQARQRWVSVRNTQGDHALSYWQQNPRGGWEQKKP